MRAVRVSIWVVSGVDLVQQHPGEFGVMVVEPAVERGDQGRVFGLHPAAGQPGEHPRIALPGDQRLDHGPPGHAHDVGGHRRHLDQGVFEQLLQPLHLRVRSWVRSVRSRV